jgi:hypothetical protein
MKKFTATFSNGQTTTRNSDHAYAFAWAIIRIETGRIADSGMSATRAKAAKNAQAQTWAPVSARDRKNPALHRYHKGLAKEHGFASVAAMYDQWDADAVAHNAAHRIEIVEVRGA